MKISSGVNLNSITYLNELKTQNESPKMETYNNTDIVNISKEESKHGLDESDVIEFINHVSVNYKNIQIKGLMTMAPFSKNEEEVRKVFKGLKQLSIEIDKMNIPNVSMEKLSTFCLILLKFSLILFIFSPTSF